MLGNRSVIKFIISMACAAALGSASVVIAQQLSQQTPTQPSSARPPDPARFAPVEDAPRFKDAAALFIVAEYISIPNITHYGIYREARDQAIKLAVEWFDQYLKK